MTSRKTRPGPGTPVAALHDWMASLDARPSEPNPRHDPAHAFVETRDRPERLR